MTKYEDIYEEAANNYGLITSARARELGVTNNELVQYARRGKLDRIGQGVYRLTHYLSTEYDSYAEAIALVGPGAFLWGESVIALLGLAPTNPANLHVASPQRSRKKLPPFIKVEKAKSGYKPTYYEGIPSQRVPDAIRACRGKMMGNRLRDATGKAHSQGFVSASEKQALLEELA